MLRPSPILLALALLAGSAPLALAQPAGDNRGLVPVVLTRADCQRLVADRPAPDVTYRPGEDVYHRPVAPADLPGSVRIDLPQTLTIDLTLDLAKRFGIPTTFGRMQQQVTVGTITVMGEQVFFNGQPLQSPEQAILAAACRRHER